MMKRMAGLTLLAMSLLPAAARVETANLDVSDDARNAAAAVDRFLASLLAGDLDRAAAELDPELIVLESGGAERSAAEYLGGHAGADAEFLKTARYTLRRRTARATGNMAWVASEGELRAEREGKPLVLASTETMVLRSTGRDWKIVHIHWSSGARNE